MTTYWAELDTNNVVTQVITGVDDAIINGMPAIDYYTSFTNKPCAQTYLDTENKIYAGINFTYDLETQNFIPPYGEIVKPLNATKT